MSITLVLGAPRTGKSTFFSKLSRKYLKKNISVWSNFYIEDTNMITLDDLNYNKMENGVIFWDEGGTDFDNRNFKDFKDRYTRFFKMHGHYKLTIYIASQSLDIDKKIRDLVTNIILVEPCFLNPFICKYRYVKQFTDIDELSKQIISAYEYKGIFPRYYLAFRYWKYFNSHWQDILNHKEVWNKWCIENEKLLQKDYTNALLDEKNKSKKR